MGQQNSAIVSKFSNSMYWSSMWTNKLTYTRKLNEDIFLNMFLPLFFKKTFLKKTNLKLLITEYLKKKTKSKLQSQFIFIGKAWFLCYQNWVVVVFFIYNSTKKEIFKKLKTRITLSIYSKLLYNTKSELKNNTIKSNYYIL